ncbi:MAG: HAD family hydrolase [Kiritimatiellia bacterium]
MPYVLWDWNGTLLDDTQASLDALNVMLARRGRPPIGMDFYRDRFAFPVRPFYEAIGIDPAGEDWNALAREYHDLYAARPKRLNPEAIAALARVRAAGVGQSIISALRQDLLDAATADCGVAPFMDCICGTDNLDGSSKLDRAVALVARLDRDFAGAEPLRVTMIGDSLHDKEVADAIGARCVLCAQGSHAGWRLRKVARTGSTLLEAVELALRDG